MSNEDLVSLYQGGNKNALALIIEKNFGLVRKVAYKFYINDSAIDMDDLFQEGSIGLIKAANGYCMDVDCSFSTYAYKCIWGTIYRFVTGKVYRLGHKDVKVVSLNIAVGDSGDGVELGDTIVSEANDYEGVEDSIFEKTVIHELLSVLDGRSREIIQLKHGIGFESLSNKDIAQKYNITPQEVHEITHKGLRKMVSSPYGRKIREENARYSIERSYSLGKVTNSLIKVMDQERKYKRTIAGTDLSLDVDVLASLYR